MSLPEGILPFQLAEDSSAHAVTSFAGLPLVIETFRGLGLGRLVQRHVHVRQRNRGHKEVVFLETLTALLAAGGDCVDDVRVLQADPGLKQLWRDSIPSPSAIRSFLNAFHDPARATSEAGTARVPEPTMPLRGLGRLNREVVRRVHGQRPQTLATIDIDATLIECRGSRSHRDSRSRSLRVIGGDPGLRGSDSLRD